MEFSRRATLKLLAASAATSLLERLPASAAAEISREPSGSAAMEVPAYKQPHLPVEVRVQDLLRHMTIEEKARQLDMYNGAHTPLNNDHDAPDRTKNPGFKPEEAAKIWGDAGVGSIHDFYPSPELSNEVQEWVIKNSRLGIPVMFIEEGLHGYPDGTIFPSPINLGATFNPDLAKRTGAAIASEARANGTDMILAPVLDLAREPRWGRVEENFGEDPYLTGQLGLAYVEGAQGDSLNTDHTLVAEPKHFVGHGSPESGVNTSPVHMGERELRMVMLKSFEPAIREGKAMAVMAAYHEIDGIPMTANPHILLKILREEWGFQGFVLADLGAIRRLNEDHRVTSTPKESVCLAINSGVDMQFYDFEHDIFQGAIIEGIKDGTLTHKALDRAVSSVLRVKFMLGLFDHPTVDPTLDAKVRRSPAHLELALESARQSMTLLKNENKLLPLSKSLKNVAVIGPNADAARYGDYADQKTGERISMLDGIRKILPQTSITFHPGDNIPEAVEKTKNAEVIVLGLGESRATSGECCDRLDIGLPDKQEELLEAVVASGKPVVLVLENGRPLTISWAAKHVPAILEAWYPGERGGTAIAETLFGENNPAGRLPVSFPKTIGQLPDFYNYDPSKRAEYVDGNISPLFPFGFGLSYTTFAYSNLKVDAPPIHSGADIIATVDVTNTGNLAGDDVVQLYLREHVTSVETPVKSLRGFSRIQLLPGETKTLTFRVPQKEIAVWNAEGHWRIEPGNFTAWAGGSSDATLNTYFVLRS